MAERTVTAEEMLNLSLQILRGLGTADAAAGQVASSLVTANQAGHDSHGVVRLVEYAACVAAGDIVPDAAPVVRHAEGAVVAVEGQRCWGQVGAHAAAEHAAVIAERLGVGVATLAGCKHVGRIGEYAEALAARGLVSLIWCDADPAVAPFGGRERALGTNPIAAGIPGPASIRSFSTSQLPQLPRASCG